jgi:hypothetical protein
VSLIGTTLIQGVTSLVSSWFETKKAKQESEAAAYKQARDNELTYDTMALKMTQFSLKDELIMLIVFSPLVIGWFDTDRANEWVSFVGELPLFYQILLFGITAATFGLQWFFRQQGLKLKGGSNGNG